MLFYRRRSLGPPAAAPAVAAHLQALLDADNQRAAVERAAYETFMNAISVRVYPERALHCRRNQGEDSLQLRGSSSSEQQDADGVDPDDRSTHVIVDIDRRAPLADLLAAVHAALSSRSAIALAADDNASSLVFAPPTANAADVRLVQLDASSRSHLAVYKLRSLGDALSADSVVSIADSGISNGDRLVAYDGQTICGAPPAFSERKGSRLVLHISHLVSNRTDSTAALSHPMTETSTAVVPDEESARHTAHQLTFVGSKDESTVDDLLAFLSAHTHLAADAMHISMLRHNSLRVIDLFESPSVSVASKSSRKGGRRLLVDDMGMADGWTLTVETAAASASESLAHAEMRARMSAVRLTIVHSCDTCTSLADQSQPESQESPAEFSLSTRSSTSLAAFKATVVSRLPDACRIQHAALGFRLRRRMGRSKEGVLFHDESLSLAACGLDEDDLFVQIEHGPLPAAHEAELGVSVRDPASQQRREFRLLLDLRRTVRETKVRILREAELPHEEDKHVRAYCLHRTDVTWNERGKLFANEAVSLEKLGVGSGDNLWMEEGALPTKGIVNLDVYLHEPHPNSGAAFCRTRLLENRAALLIPGSSEASRGSTSVADDTASDACSGGSVVIETAGATPTAAAGAAAADMAATSATASDCAAAESGVGATAAGAEYGIHRLFSLEAQSGEPLHELRLALHSNPLLAARAPSAAHLRVRLFRGHAPGKLVPADDRALNKQGITADRSVIVQVMSTPDDGNGVENVSAKVKTVAHPHALSAHAQLLQVYLALPHPSKDGALLYSMFPIEVLWDGGVVCADYESLHAAVFAALGCDAAAPRKLLLAKWASSERRWVLLAPEFAAQELRLAAEAEEKKSAQRTAQLQTRAGADARPLAVAAASASDSASSSDAATAAAAAASEAHAARPDLAQVDPQQDAIAIAESGIDRTDVDDSIMASLSDADLEQLLASGFDLDTGSMADARAVLAACKPHASESSSRPGAQRALGSRNTKAHKTILTKAPKNLKSNAMSAEGRANKAVHANAGKGSVAALSEKQLEMLGLRGKPYLLRDGDVLVAIDPLDVHSATPGFGDAAASLSADADVAESAPMKDTMSELAQRIATWGPPPGALSGGAGGAGQSDLQRAIEESLRGIASSAAPEVGIHIEVDV